MDSAWWPRKADLSRQDYVGSAVCGECHSTLVLGQKQHAMAQTSLQASQSEALDKPAKISLGKFQYSIERNGTDASYVVTNGQERFSGTLLWAIGSGGHGQTFLFRDGNDWRETEVSFFTGIGFDLTPGRHEIIPTFADAVGRKLSEDDAEKCFGCHATAALVDNRFDSRHLMPGISCEGCHGPGAAHVAAASAGDTDPEMIMNPATLDPVSSVDFCGSCHRTWWDVMQLGSVGVNNVRFPAYRLETSPCWGNGDARLTCVACHDPHKPLVTSTSFYDSKCLNCHVQSPSMAPTNDHPGRGCPTSTSNCVTCHMPKYQLRQMHAAFTDHDIRVVRNPGSFPER